MLGEVFKRFIEASPLSVMMRGLVERLLNPARLDAWFAQVTQAQYTRELLFSTVVGLMLEVVCGSRKSINAGYQALVEQIPVSIQSVYNKLNGIEPGVAAELVRYAAREGQAVIEHLHGERPALLAGYQVRILDGNQLAASEHRLKELRAYTGGALPGKSLVVYDPDLDLAVDVVPCENGHTQERALVGEVLPTVRPQQVWIMDRNFCVLRFLDGIGHRQAYFVVREHEQLRWDPCGAMRPFGRIATGQVSEQTIRVVGTDGQEQHWRRIRVELDQPTRNGEDRLYLLTTLPATIDAGTLARVYQGRWRIETAFYHLAQDLNTEIHTLGYPRAALFGFCVGLVAYNTLAVLKAALRRVHGAQAVDEHLSGYYLADEVGGTYRGMMIAIPPEEWHVFRHLTFPQLAEVVVELAAKVRLAAFRKQRRGPKKPPVKRPFDPKHPHQATAKLLANRRK
jgi:IS4 transposase